jgi:tetratricopeptide (TPR) repeat protein
MPRRALAAFVLIFLMSAAAEAQFTNIQGWIIVPAYKHTDNFEVRITVRDGEQTFASTQVGDSGRFMFANLDLSIGNYDLLVRLDGFRESRTPLQSGLTATSDSYLSGNIILIPDPESRRLMEKQDAYTAALLDEYSKALDDITSKHPDRAVSHLEKVVSEVPGFYDAHMNLGLVYQDLSRRSEAEREFRRAHELNEESARPFLALGRMLLEEADIEIGAGSKPEVFQPRLRQAREVLTEVVALDPKLAKAFYYLGAVDFRSRSYADSDRELKHALELEPTLFEARITLINLYIDQKLWQPALDNVDTFLLEFPNSPYRAEIAVTRSRVVAHLETR